jgi:sugar lactone lactonase YvrE
MSDDDSHDGHDVSLTERTRRASVMPVSASMPPRTLACCPTSALCTLFGAGGPDGMTMDAAGRLYVAHVRPGDVFVYAPNGEITHAIRSCAGSAVTNLAIRDGKAWIMEPETGQ